MKLQEALLDIEEQFWRAAGNGAFYRERFADDGLMVFPIGVLTKEETISAVDASDPWASFRIDNSRLIRLGDDSACLTYRATARRTGQSEYASLIQSVYVKRNGDWKMGLHQQTPIETGP